MKTDILLFGQLAEVVGCTQMTLEGVSDTNKLMEEMHKQFPALAQSKYVVAVNKQVITKNTQLSNNSIVAILPPFSGG